MAVTKGKVIRYAVLPGLIPRVMAFLRSGFSNLAYYIALVYSMVRLLPNGHAYLNPQNIGKYGVRQVIAEAANNLVFKRKNADQIIIFFTILVGIILILVQFILLGVAFLAYKPAMAVGFTPGDLFNNPNTVTNSLGPTQDIAFIVLDRVFGLVGIYDSCISTAVACLDNAGNPITSTIAPYPYPFHEALHKMLRFYSLGILFVGAWVLIYFVITVAGETASTGTPFGQRFNKGWVPIRIIMFFALLIPINIGGQNEGLNGAQIITFWVAKHGSNLATNGWSYFNTKLTSEYLGEQSNLIATPNIPELDALNQFFLTARTCAIAEAYHDEKIITPYIVRSSPAASTGAAAGPIPGAPDTLDFLGTGYTAAKDFNLNGDITIRFGELGQDLNGDGNIDQHNNHRGYVFSYCGDIVINTNDVHEPGSIYIAEQYYNMLQNMWNDTSTTDVATCIVDNAINRSLNHDPTCTPVADDTYVDAVRLTFKQYIQDAVTDGIEEQKNNGEFTLPTEVLEKGWGGAAIWYNRIANMNGAVTTATFNIPRPYKYPDVLEAVYDIRVQEDENVTAGSRFSLSRQDGQLITLPGNRETIHAPVYAAFEFWENDGRASGSQPDSSDNVVINFINAVLGTSGIFEMRKNADIHPLAQLSSLGKSMMEATIRNALYATAGSVASGIAGIIDPFPAQLTGAASSFLFSMVSVSIGISVILFYVLPIMPFIYFLFALSGWIKSIFEAIVAMPLWALAHLRIEGDGLPGPAAANGYYLLLEIFIRPILILFGLLASISIFSGLVFVLNNMFELVVSNTGGFDLEQANAASTNSLEHYRAPIDEFFFTAVYAIICYMVGLACFKLVDQIPNNILRWAGVTASTFQENAGDPAGTLSNQVYRGSILITNQVKGATQGNLAAIVG